MTTDLSSSDPRYRMFRRMALRNMRLMVRTLQPPRELRFADGVLSWKPPEETAGITHYRIYLENELQVSRQVPVGQTFLREKLIANRVFVSSYNEPMDASSRLASFPASGETYIYDDSGEAGFAKATFGIDGETEIGTDFGPRHLVRTSGVPHWVSVNASSVTADLIQDIQYSADGITWASIFDDGDENKVNLPAGTKEQLTFSEFKAGIEFVTGGLLRRDVIAGEAEDVELVLEYGAVVILHG